MAERVEASCSWLWLRFVHFGNAISARVTGAAPRGRPVSGPAAAAHPQGIPPTSATYEGRCQRSEAANFVHTSHLHLQAIIAIGMVCDQHPKVTSRVGEVGAGRVGSYGATEHSLHVLAPPDAG